jgi:SAM-dependent methyltransferase
MSNYYSRKLSAARLCKCYEIAPPRVRQYLEAEIDFVLDNIKPLDRVLELGCGYGRALGRFIEKSGMVVGIDTSYESLALARETIGDSPECCLAEMDAARPGFADGCFDLVACIQNGISAFKVDRLNLIRESLRVTRIGGTALFSSYSESFWSDRLEWFEIQAGHGLVGEIDYDATGDGVIVCKDGFRAETISPGEFGNLVSGFEVESIITEVDNSSIFCVIKKTA